MKTEKPNWDRMGKGPMMWVLGPASEISEGLFRHGPVESTRDILHLANEGDILVGRMQDTKEVAAMYLAFDNHFTRLHDGMSGRLYEALSAALEPTEISLSPGSA
ncbi:hypothetical protein AB9K35_16750 [Leisingera sp. XS_AS12]|uniref:hypothetical protein n=1 Tax=Leisingera sp. XS_AS12 TaxID=3241294 RepID=UPI0035148364